MNRAKSTRYCYECGKRTEGGDVLCAACLAKKDAREAKREAEYRELGWNMALYYARRAKGLSRRGLSRLAGISETTYDKCESGTGDLTEPNRARVARVLGVPVTKLWDEPYKVRCRNCLTMFVPTRNEHVCPSCREDARREAREHGRHTAPGSNQKRIATIARMARKQGMTYGAYVARERKIGNEY